MSITSFLLPAYRRQVPIRGGLLLMRFVVNLTCDSADVRLYPSDTRGIDHAGLTRPIAEGVVATLVDDLPNAIASVSAEAIAAWGLRTEDLLRLALENVRKEGG